MFSQASTGQFTDRWKDEIEIGHRRFIIVTEHIERFEILRIVNDEEGLIVHDCFTEISLVDASKIAIVGKIMEVRAFPQVVHRLRIRDSWIFLLMKKLIEIFGANVVLRQKYKLVWTLIVNSSGNRSKEVNVDVEQLVEFC